MPIKISDGEIDIDDETVRKLSGIFSPLNSNKLGWRSNFLASLLNIVSDNALIITSMLGGFFLTMYEHGQITDGRNEERILLFSKKSPFGIALMYAKNTSFALFAIYVPLATHKFIIPKFLSFLRR